MIGEGINDAPALAAATVGAATGKIGPVGAALTHQLSSFFVMMNSLRLLRAGGRTARWRGWAGSIWQDSRLSPWLESLRERSLHLEFGALAEWVATRSNAWRKPVLVMIPVLLVLSGFYTLGPDETGIVERFGRKMVPNREAGIHYKRPWPIERLTRIQAQQVRVVEIGFRSKRSANDAEPAPRSIIVPNIRTTFCFNSWTAPRRFVPLLNR